MRRPSAPRSPVSSSNAAWAASSSFSRLESRRRVSASSASSPGLRVHLRQLGDGVAQILLVAAGARQRGLGLGAGGCGGPPVPPAVADLGRLLAEAAEGVEHGAVVGAVEQALLLELALDLHQQLADTPQQGDADGLVVDEGAAAAVGAELAAQDDVAVVGEALLVEQCAHGMVGDNRELGADAGLPGARAEQLQIGAAAEGEAEGIQQDRLAGAGLAGQHGEAGIDLEIQAVDEDDVANRQVQQHRRSAAGHQNTALSQEPSFLIGSRSALVRRL